MPIFQCFSIFRVLFLIWMSLCFCLSQTVSASKKETGFPLVTNYTAGKYNAHTQNWGIIQDDLGIMYFANGDGVLVYDGNSWELIELPNKISARALGKDQQGIIYTAGTNEIGYLQPNQFGKLEYISLIDSLGISNIGTIRDILTIDSCIFFRSQEYLIRLNQTGFKYWKANSSYTYFFVFKDVLFIEDEEFGLYKLLGDSLVMAPSGRDFINKKFFFAKQYKNEVVLANRIRGLYTYEPESNKPEKLIHIVSSANQTLINDFVNSGIVTNDDNIILGTNSGGCIIVNIKGETLSRITDRTGIQDKNVHALFVDKNENLWLALNNGIVRCNITEPISYWSKPQGLDGTITSMIRYQGTLFIGSTQGLYNLQDNKICKIQSGISQAWSFLNFKTPNSNKEVLLIGAIEGVFVFDNNRLTQIPIPTVGYTLYQSQRNPNIIYVGLLNNIGILEYKNGNFVYKGVIPNSGVSVRSIVENENGEIWMGTYRSGVIRMIPSENILEPKEVISYRLESGLPSLKNVLLYFLNGKLVFATERGLYYFDKNSNKFHSDTTLKTYFPGKSKDIYALREDKLGNVYITQLVTKQGSIVVATKRPDGRYNWNSTIYNKMPRMTINMLYLDDQENLWLGGSEGLFKIDQSIKRQHDVSFNTIIRSVKIKRDSCIFYGNFYIEKKSEKYFSATQNESLKYDIKYRYNSITFNYSAPEFNNEFELKYKFMLDGYDDKWSDWTTSTIKEYTNLHEGPYTFRVVSKNIYDIEGKESTFEFYILPPWYRTEIIYLTYLVFAILLILTIVKISNRKLKDTNIDLEKQVLIRTAEISQQKEELLTQSEELLAQSEELERSNLELEKLSIVASRTDNAIVIMDSQGNFEWVNEGFTNLYGLRFEEFLNKRGENIFECTSSPEILRELHKCINEKKTISYEFFYEDDADKKIWAQTTITPILDERNNIVNLIAIDSDITKLKLAEQEIIQHKSEIEAQRDFSEQQKEFIEQQNRELEKHRTRLEQLVRERTSELEIAKEHAIESDRLKSAFLANMSHEIRTPMNAIIGFSNLLKDPEITKEEKDEFTHQITLNSNTLLQLIDDIIDISKIEAGQLIFEKKYFNVNSLLKELLVTFLQKKNSIYNKEIDLRLQPEIENSSFIIFTDPLRLQQVISNLVDNALKFTDQGFVEIGYTLEENSSFPMIRFYVKDSGIGLTQEQQKLIFNRFTKIENDKNKLYRGTGLGLVISKNIVTLLGGQIYVESELNQGSNFNFTIPNNNDFGETEIKVANPTKAFEYNWIGKTILIAEDEKSNFRFLEVLLKRTNVNIIRAVNGLEAIYFFKNDKIDLILMDIKMPVMDGLEATREIKKLNRDIPIIALTAYAMQNDSNICLDAGCNDYVSKPISSDKLFLVVDKYLLK
jgi:PAS domain S-box-containing protein